MTKNLFPIITFQNLWMAVGMIFIFLFAILSYYNHFSADDFYYMGCHARGESSFTCMNTIYENYSGRWSAYLLTGYIVGLREIPNSHFIFNILTFSILVSVITILLQNIFQLYLNQKIPLFKIFTYSVLLVALLFFSSFSIGETWFWLIQVCTYLWGLILFLSIVTILLLNKNHWFYYMFLAILAFFTGGGSESYSLNFIFLFSTLLLFCNFSIGGFQIKTKLHLKTLNIQLVITLVFLLAGFTITMLASGNSMRYEALPKTDNVGLVWVQFRSIAQIFIYKLPSVLPYLLLFGLIWFFIGKDYSKKRPEISIKTFTKKHILITCLIVGLIFIFLIPTSVIMVDLGPDRALSIISFTLAFYTVFFFFDAGRNLFQNKTFHFYHWILVITNVSFLLWQTINQYHTVTKYDEAFETRMKILIDLKEKGNTRLIELPTLPSSGMLYSAEITNNTKHFRNQFLGEALELDFEIKLADK